MLTEHIPIYVKCYIQRWKKVPPNYDPNDMTFAYLLKRKILTTNIVMRSEKLSLAAVLEYNVGRKTMTVSQARYAYVSQYPESNRLPDVKDLFDGSVISLIQPYEESLRSDITMDSYFKRLAIQESEEKKYEESKY